MAAVSAMGAGRLWGPIGWMAGASSGACLALTVGFRGAHPEVLFGMLGPTVGAVVSWVTMVRASLVGPEHLTRVMMLALGAKMVWFGAYVAIALQGFALRPLPFVASFAGFFIALYALEAVFLKGLPIGGPQSPSA
jgi:hypothetical protein